MTLNELREALKRLDRDLSAMARVDNRLVAIYETVSDLGEYLLMSHSRMDRLQSEVELLKKYRAKLSPQKPSQDSP